MPLIEIKDKECPKCKGRMIKLWIQTGGHHCEVGGTSGDMFDVIYKNNSFYECRDCGSRLMTSNDIK